MAEDVRGQKQELRGKDEGNEKKRKSEKVMETGMRVIFVVQCPFDLFNSRRDKNQN